MADYILTLPTDVTGGSFTLTVGADTTDAITIPATADDIQTAINLLDGEEAATVSGEPNGPFIISNTTVAPTADGTGLEGGSTDITVIENSVEEPPATNEENPPVTNPDLTGNNNYDALNTAKGKLIRKALGGIILAAPIESEVPEKLMADAEGNFVDLKSMGYNCIGWVSKGDGINFARETEQAEVESFGAQEPTRVDITKDVTSSTFKCQETNKQVMEMYYNLSLDGVTMDENGEFAFNNERNPSVIPRRMIYIAKDGNGDDAKYIAKIMPRAILSEAQEQAWTPETELNYGLTMKATQDDDLGYSVRHVFAGPGFLKLKEDMGF